MYYTKEDRVGQSVSQAIRQSVSRSVSQSVGRSFSGGDDGCGVCDKEGRKMEGGKERTII